MCSMRWLWRWLALTAHKSLIMDCGTTLPNIWLICTIWWANVTSRFLKTLELILAESPSRFDQVCEKSKTKSPTLTLAFLTRQKRFSLVNLKRCDVIKMRVMIKERLGSAASCGVGGADKNRLHYAVHLVNKWNNGEACSGNAGRMAQNPIESFWPLAA